MGRHGNKKCSSKSVPVNIQPTLGMQDLANFIHDSAVTNQNASSIVELGENAANSEAVEKSVLSRTEKMKRPIKLPKSDDEMSLTKAETELLEKLLSLSIKRAEESAEMHCSYCKNKTTIKCTGCRRVFYCGKECQKEDWKHHKNACRPFNILKTKEGHRYIVASRDIFPDDIIIQEPPLIIGPRQETEPVCLTCYRRVNGSYRCSKCTWPLCGPVCEAGRYHKYECKITKLAGVQIPDSILTNSDYNWYGAITILRCLGIQAEDPKRWSNGIDKMSSKYLQIASSSQFEKSNMPVITLLQEKFNLHTQPNLKSSLNSILRIMALIQVNTISTKLAYSEVQALYSLGSLMEHSCTPNTKLEWNNLNHTMNIKATEKIPQGTAITTIYTDILWGTRARRDHLQMRLIDCCCRRCSDPTELETYFSALICQRCVKRSSVLPIDPLDRLSPWKCVECPYQIEAEEAVNTTLILGASVASALRNPTVESLEILKTEWLDRVHSNHYHLHAVRHSLLQLYGRKDRVLTQCYWEEINKKEKACKDFLKICALLDPALGYTLSFVGLSFYEHHKTILETAKISYAQSSITIQQLKKRVLLSKALLKKAMEIFKDEEEDTPEGQLYISCQQDILSITKYMQSTNLI